MKFSFNILLPVFLPLLLLSFPPKTYGGENGDTGKTGRNASVSILESQEVHESTDAATSGSDKAGSAASGPAARPSRFNNALTIDLLPTVLGIIGGGFGLGLEYERLLSRMWGFNLRGSFIMTPLKSSENPGTLLNGSLGGGVLFYPLNRGPAGLALGMHAGVFLFGGVSQPLSSSGVSAGTDGTENSSFMLFPLLSAELGWAFRIGSGKIGFFIKPFLHYVLLFPLYHSVVYETYTFAGPFDTVIGLFTAGVGIGITF